MDFDFHTSFSGKTTEELLQIVLQKDLYQPAAIQAAEKILASRNVTEDEIAAAKGAIDQKAIAIEKRKEQKEKFKSEATNAVYSVLFPTQRTSAYFIRFFAISFLVIWLISTVSSFREYFYVLSDSPVWGLIIIVMEALTLLMIYWLFKLNKKGWVLVMIYFTWTVGDSIHSLLDWSEPKFAFSFQADRSVFIIRLFISGLVFYFFNRKDVVYTFGISKRFQKNVIFFCALSMVLFYLLFYFGDVDIGYYFSDL